MAEHFRFFDSTDPSNPDRTYNAQEFTDYFKALVTTGVMQGVHNELRVTTMGSNMQTVVDTGIAFIEGRYYENDSVLALTHDTEVLGMNRIDRVVIRLDLSPENRHVKAFIKKGSPSENPIPPVLTRDETTYEISLAQVFIEGGQTYIDSMSITDERGDDYYCPWAGSNILPNFDDADLENLVEKVNNAVLTDSRTEIWVDATSGNDANGDGSQSNPYASLDKALESIKKYHPETVTIKVHPGTYETPSSTSTNGHIAKELVIESSDRNTGYASRATINGSMEFRYCQGKFELSRLDVKADPYGAGVFFNDHNGIVVLRDVEVSEVYDPSNVGNVFDGFEFNGNCVANLTYSRVNNARDCIKVTDGATVVDSNTSGTNNETAFVASGGTIFNPSTLLEATTKQRVSEGGQVLDN